ncbi:ArsR family transcriptional regulator [Candidatus Bathyarchaeota archaeon]|nr:MAG: ArsR family transcriptional regulator [Candidatus Bathyarchaeota archaeon]
MGNVIHLASKEKKMNRYFLSIPVTDYREARALGSRTNWEIIEALRDAGSAGLTAKEMMKQLNLSKNTVYGAIKFLEGPSQDASWVESRRPPKKHPGKKKTEEKYREVIVHGKPERIELIGTATRIYVEEVPFGQSFVAQDFTDAIDPIIEKAVSELKEKWAQTIDLVIEECKKGDKKRFFPDHDRPCDICGVKHEAVEFLQAISTVLEIALYNAVNEKLFAKHGFGHPKPERVY